MASFETGLRIAIEHHQAGKWQLAEQCYRELLRGHPRHAHLLHYWGLLLVQTNRWEEGCECLEQALALQPHEALFYTNLERLMQQPNLSPVAKTRLQRALTRKQQQIDLKQREGVAMYAQHLLQEAMTCFQQVLALQPENAEACNNLGATFHKLGDFSQASTYYQQAISLQPNYADAIYNLGTSYYEQEAYADAIACFEQTLQLHPSRAEAYNNLGNAWQELGQYTPAMEAYRRALELKPVYPLARLNLAMLQLLHGDFAQAWPDYESRWLAGDARGKLPTHSEPMWQGEALPGKTLLLHAEQGLGDAFQFIRYVSRIKPLVGRIVLHGPKPLIPLLSRMPELADVCAWDQTPPRFDVWLPLLSLPRVFGTQLETIPASIPYLQADESLVAQWKQRLEHLRGFRVGLHWNGKINQGPRRLRNVPIEYFSKIIQLPGVHAISLQQQISMAESAWLQQFQVTDFSAELDTASGAFMDTAAIIKNLDLVITSDTSVAHLAGALGVRTWLLLPFVPDWRWMLNRDDSPWYPSVRLFRQTQRGEWGDVFDRVREALQQRLGAQHGHH